MRQLVDQAATRHTPRRGRFELFLYAAVVIAAGLGYFVYFQWFGSEASWRAAALPKPPKAPLVNRIAFVGLDGEVWTVSPDGKDQQPVTRDGRGYWRPSWSPDGRWLGFMGGNFYSDAAYFVAPADGGVATPMVGSQTSRPNAVQWTADSSSLVVLSMDQGGWSTPWSRSRQDWQQTLRTVRVVAPAENKVLVTGPFTYFTFSKKLDHIYLAKQGQLLDLPAGGNTESAPTRAVAQIGMDLPPVLSSDEKRLFFNRLETAANARPGPGEGALTPAANTAAFPAQPRWQLIVRDLQTDEEKAIATLDPGLIARVYCSPASATIAYQTIAIGESPPRPSREPSMICDPQGDVPPRSLGYAALALAWSPDGKKLALLCRANDAENALRDGDRSRAVQWVVHDVETGQSTPLFDYYLPEGMRGGAPRGFDGYNNSRSKQVWSPDSRHLLAEGVADGRQLIWVVDTTQEHPAFEIAEGVHATWSER